MRSIASGFSHVLVVLAAALFAPSATAAGFHFKVLIDADASASSGCSVTLPNGSSVAGIDAVITTAVLVDDASGRGNVTSVAAAGCGATGTLGPASAIDVNQWSAAGPYLIVETHVSLAQVRSVLAPGVTLTPKQRLIFVVVPAAGPGGDAILTDGSESILFPPSRSAKPHAVRSSPTFVLDGKPEDWGAQNAYPADDSQYQGVIKLAGAYAAEVGSTMYLRFDAAVGGSFFRAAPQVLPTAGPTPLTVSFVSKAEYTGTQIVRYRWDFEGDGVFDTDDPGARTFTRTFTTPGVRNAILEVTNDKNQVTQSTVPINVTGAPPVASAGVSPSNGAVPLNVVLTGSALRGTAPIAKYEWDFDGDGTYDFSSTTSGTTSHVYASPGTYASKFRVTDTAGLQASASATATAVRVGPPGSPSATITLPSNAISRTAPATVSFDGTGTTPTGTITKYDWDFNGDGIYDSSSATAATSTTFASPGTFTVALRVTNSAGLSSIATVDVTIAMTASLTLSTDTLRLPGNVSVNTTIGGTAPVTVFIKDKSGQTVRTLVANKVRTAGSYADIWDGAAPDGKPVREGEYFAVLEYLANGIPVFVDATATTGDVLYNPTLSLSTTKGGNCDTCPFAPYENNYLQAALTLDRASEVTISIRGYDSVNEVARLFDRRTFGRGKTYTVVWEGTDAKGQLVHPSLYNDRQFIFGMTAFTLPDNAIFVEGAPELSNVAVTPNYFDPFTADFLTPQKPTAKASYTLSKPATVRLQVYRVGTNLLLRTIAIPNAASGAGSITWDGRDDHGIFADKGDYRLALKATDAAGNESLVRYALMKVYY